MTEKTDTTKPTPQPAVTKEQIQEALPKGLRFNVSDDFVNIYNDAIGCIDSDLVYVFRENFVTYSNVLEGSKYTTEQYINAVKYVSFKLMGYTNRDSYKMTFPDRFDAFMVRYRAEGFDDKFIWDYKISPHVVSFNKTKIVNQILEQSLVPTHVLNQGMYQEALNVQANLMMHARSEMVRATAANSILTQLKAPEVAKVEIDMKVTESDAIKDLRRVTQELSAAQRLSIQSGVATPLQIAESKIIEAVIEEE